MDERELIERELTSETRMMQRQELFKRLRKLDLSSQAASQPDRKPRSLASSKTS